MRGSATGATEAEDVEDVSTPGWKKLAFREKSAIRRATTHLIINASHSPYSPRKAEIGGQMANAGEDFFAFWGCDKLQPFTTSVYRRGR
jgi:hypothetical protein